MKFLQKVKKPISLTSLLLGSMAAYDKHRGVDVIHASDLTKDEGFCPKEFAILYHLGKTKKGFGISAGMRHTWDMGRDIEARIQNEYLLDFAVGDWKCTSCGTLKQFQKKPKTGCHREDINCNWRYSEVRLIANSITGGFDLFVDIGKTKLRLVELKSVILHDFEKLKAPLAEHRLRTNLYLRMIADSPLAEHVETQVAHVLYIAKSFGKWSPEDKTISPFKEYEVVRDDSITDKLLGRAGEYQAFRTMGMIPNRICPTAACKRAKTCSVVGACFSKAFKSGTTLSNVPE